MLLTSLTTIAGLMPLLLETSFQAQMLIPMAVSLSCGLMLATTLVLYLVPVFYRIYASLARIPETGSEHAEPTTKTQPGPQVADGEEAYPPDVVPALNRDLGVEGT